MNSILIGLTGQTGAGKSTLSRLFADWGATVIDADQAARETIEQSKSCLSDLVIAFSTEVIRPDATLNRAQLAKICFSDKQKLRRLNEITFPYIIETILHKIEQARASGARMILLDAPTLFESGLDSRCDRVVAVVADFETRVARIIARDGLADADARRRATAQNEDEYYTSRAQDVIENSGEEGALRIAFIDLFNRYEAILNGVSQAEPAEESEEETE